MTTIQTIEKVDIKDITEVFNSSFSDYFVPMKLSVEQLKTKFEAENIALNYSVGAFDNGKLVGFILHCYRLENNIKQLYNGGTGVLKNYRGNGLTRKMYDFIIPKLENDAISNIHLEVLSQNYQAIKSYQNVGFKETRDLLCFKGSPLITKTNNEVTIEKLSCFDWKTLQTFWSIVPTWQSSIYTISNLGENVLAYGAYLHSKLIGYIIFNHSVNRILQLAVMPEFRNIGIGKRLIQALDQSCQNPISIINVDNKDKSTVLFFEKIGLENNVNQIEMIYNIIK